MFNTPFVFFTPSVSGNVYQKLDTLQLKSDTNIRKDTAR